jgi:hypothetical protein
MLDICLCQMCILSQPFLSLIVFWQSVVIVLSKCNGGGKSIGNNSNIQHQNQKTNHYITNKSASQHKAQISSCRSYIAWKFVTDWRNWGIRKLLNMSPWYLGAGLKGWWCQDPGEWLTRLFGCMVVLVVFLVIVLLVGHNSILFGNLCTQACVKPAKQTQYKASCQLSLLFRITTLCLAVNSYLLQSTNG